jgi:hypothetical protein
LTAAKVLAQARRRAATRTQCSSWRPAPPSSTSDYQWFRRGVLTRGYRNVVIGANQAEGIHCLGPCNLYNVWFEDVCEDAITLKQTSGTTNIVGGGAKNASDKVVQHNGGGEYSVLRE